MKSIIIEGKKRESVGKSSTKALRKAEQVPCVIYSGEAVVHFYAPEKSFKNLVYTPDAHIVEVKLDNGENIKSIMQDIQFHPVTDRILHIDFYRLSDDKEVSINVPIKISGNSVGVIKGGVLRVSNRKLKVKALPENLPDFIDADISDLDIGSKLYVTQVSQEKFKIMHPENTVILAVKTSRTTTKDDTTTSEETKEVATEA